MTDNTKASDLVIIADKADVPVNPDEVRLAQMGTYSQVHA